MVALLPALSVIAGGGSWLPVGAELSADDAPTGYVVQPGDTLYSIARRHGSEVDTLVTLNALADPSHIRAGQILVLTPTAQDAGGIEVQRPGAADRYTVVAGDTLYGLARRFGVSVQALLDENSLPNPSLLLVGQVLTIPKSTAGAVSPAMANGGVRPGLPGSSAVPVPVSVPVPVTAGPVGSGTTLPTSLFGRAATDQTRLALIPSFDRWAAHYRIDGNLLKGLAFVESSWRADAVSSAGAVGVGQLMPATSGWIAGHLIGDPGLDPWRADDNIRMSARYVRYLIDQLVVEDQAIGAYYQGIGSVQREGVAAPTLQYIERVRVAQAAFVAG